MIPAFLKQNLIFRAALLIGGIGAVGQAGLRWHELAECLPYKVIAPYFYERIALIGVVAAPLAAVAGGYLFGRRRYWLATLAPVVLCPAVFAVVYMLATSLFGFGAITDGPETGDLSPHAARGQFLLETAMLAAQGIIAAAAVNISFLLAATPGRRLP